MTECIAATCSRDLRDHEIAVQLLCTPCCQQMKAWLSAIPNLLIVLRDGSLQRERSGDAVRGGTREAPLPGRITTMNFIGPASRADVRDPHGDQTGSRPLIGTLGDWTQLILDQRPAVHPPRVWTETVLADWLTSQLRWTVRKDFAGVMYDEIGEMIHTALGIAGIQARTRAISRPCPNCQLMTLTSQDWDLYTRCFGCGNSYTQSELNDDAPRQLDALDEQHSAA